MSQSDLVYVNGSLMQSKLAVSVYNRGLAYGDGVFETIRVIEGIAPLKAHHFSRLKHSLAYFGLRPASDFFDSLDFFFDHIKLQKQSSGRLKIIVTRGEGGRGYVPDADAQANSVCVFSANDALSNTWLQASCELINANTPLSCNPVLAKHKHLNRLDYVLAAQSTPIKQNQQLLMHDSKKRIVESLHHNLFVIKNDRIYSPVLNECGVEGVFKNFLVGDVLPTLNIHYEECHLLEQTLQSADAIFLTNAFSGVTPVLQYGETMFEHAENINAFNTLVSASEKLLNGDQI